MRRLSLLIAVVMFAGCDGGSPSVSPPATGVAGQAATGARRSEDAELARGQILSLACQACHSFDEGGLQLVGPNLHGVFGRPAGSLAGFSDYSEALRSADWVWSPGLLDQWLKNPADFLPGTTMAFTGYQSAEDRQALIRYLIEATGAAASDAAD
jgi:cytochrome c